MHRAVFDTNVVRAALWSSSGASFQLLRRIPDPAITLLLSEALYLEYQEVLTRPENLPPGVTPDRMLRFLRRFSAFASFPKIYFRWRPWLRDPDDNMILELAVAGAATHLVTFNLKDFKGVEEWFGIRVLTPPAFQAILSNK
jgi:putative PIN family toxin of toxin-antitoxin system